MTEPNKESQTDEQEQLLDEVRPLMGPPPEELPAQSVHPIDAEEVVEAPLPDDTTTSEAVEDIVAEESSKLIEAEDEKLAAAFVAKTPKRSFRSLIGLWWRNRRARRITLIILLLLIITTFAIPVSRYTILNSLGVRVSASFTVLDDTTDQPIKNVDITVGIETAKTDDSGKAVVRHLRQGKNSLTIKKRSFSEKTETITLGWGSNPLSPYKLTPTGTQYNFLVTDWLSGAPVEKVQISEGDSSTFTDAKGAATLTVDAAEKTELTITFKAANYRTDTVKISAGRKDPFKQKLVAESPSFFMSKRNGNYDLYRIDGDGTKEELLLAGTGKERDDIVVSPSLDKKYVALVSTRKGTLNKDGYALQGLIAVEVQSKKVIEISESEQVRIIGWVGNSIIYVKVISGASGADPNRQKLVAYDVVTSNLQDLAASNNFNDVSIVGERIYYAPGNIYGDNPSAAFMSIRVDASDKQTHLSSETWSLVRTAHDTFSVSIVGNKWFSYKIGDAKAASMPTPAAVPRDRQYSDSPDGSYSVWVDYRDGKGVIVLWDKATNQEKVIFSKAGVNYPLEWLSNRHVVFRVSTSLENANYVINVQGGDPQKVADVANLTSNGGNGYYY